MRLMRTAALTGIVIGLALPETGRAQSHDQQASPGWWNWALADQGGQGRGVPGKGPAFCRSGAGHPVHGRQWCLDHGFGLGGRGWQRASWDGVVFHERTGFVRPDGRLGASELRQLLGAEVFGRLADVARQERRSGDFLNGRWAPTDGRRARVLQVRVTDEPLAELSDVDGDGRVDAVLLHTGH